MISSEAPCSIELNEDAISIPENGSCIGWKKFKRIVKKKVFYCSRG
jgi:hypothetical protein